MKKKIPKYLFHKSPISNRVSIKRYGLVPHVGPSYLCHYDFNNNLKPLVFLYDRNIIEYDTTYDDDIYKIDAEKLDKRRLAKDPDRSMVGCFAYSAIIPNTSYEIVHKGTGKETSAKIENE